MSKVLKTNSCDDSIVIFSLLLYPPSEHSERGIYCDACCPSVVLSFCPSVHNQYLDANISKTV